MLSSNFVQPSSTPRPQSTQQATPQPAGTGQQQHAVNPFTASAQQQQPGNIDFSNFSDSVYMYQYCILLYIQFKCHFQGGHIQEVAPGGGGVAVSL